MRFTPGSLLVLAALLSFKNAQAITSRDITETVSQAASSDTGYPYPAKLIAGFKDLLERNGIPHFNIVVIGADLLPCTPGSDCAFNYLPQLPPNAQPIDASDKDYKYLVHIFSSGWVNVCYGIRTPDNFNWLAQTHAPICKNLNADVIPCVSGGVNTVCSLVFPAGG